MIYGILKLDFLLEILLWLDIVTAKTQKKMLKSNYNNLGFYLSENKATFKEASKLCFANHRGHLAVYKMAQLWNTIERNLIKYHGKLIYFMLLTNIVLKL